MNLLDYLGTNPERQDDYYLRHQPESSDPLFGWERSTLMPLGMLLNTLGMSKEQYESAMVDPNEKLRTLAEKYPDQITYTGLPPDMLRGTFGGLASSMLPYDITPQQMTQDMALFTAMRLGSGLKRGAQTTAQQFRKAASDYMRWGTDFNQTRAAIGQSPLARMRMYNILKQEIDAMPKGVEKGIAEKWFKGIKSPDDIVGLENTAQIIHRWKSKQMNLAETLVKADFGPDEGQIVVDKAWDTIRKELTGKRGKTTLVQTPQEAERAMGAKPISKKEWPQLSQRQGSTTSGKTGSLPYPSAPQVNAELMISPEREEAIQRALSFTTGGNKPNVIKQLNAVRDILRTDENLQKALATEFIEYGQTSGWPAALAYIRQRYLGTGQQYLNANDDIFNIIQKGYEHGWIDINPLVKANVEGGIVGLPMGGVAGERAGIKFRRYIDSDGVSRAMPEGMMVPIEPTRKIGMASDYPQSGGQAVKELEKAIPYDKLNAEYQLRYPREKHYRSMRNLLREGSLKTEQIDPVELIEIMKLPAVEEPSLIDILKNVITNESGTFSNKDLKDLIRSETYRPGATKGKRLSTPTTLKEFLDEPASKSYELGTAPEHMREYTAKELLELLKKNPKNASAIMRELLKKVKTE